MQPSSIDTTTIQNALVSEGKLLTAMDNKTTTNLNPWVYAVSPNPSDSPATALTAISKTAKTDAQQKSIKPAEAF